MIDEIDTWGWIEASEQELTLELHHGHVWGRASILLPPIPPGNTKGYFVVEVRGNNWGNVTGFAQEDETYDEALSEVKKWCEKTIHDRLLETAESCLKIREALLELGES